MFLERFITIMIRRYNQVAVSFDIQLKTRHKMSTL